MTAQAIRRPGPGLRGRLGRALPYILLAPGLFWLTIFYVVPAIQMFTYSISTGSVETGYTMTLSADAYTEALNRFGKQFVNSILYGGDSIQSDFGPTNFTIGYCDISEAWPGTGNFMAGPLFVNAAAHDYHLQPYSPCIDSGNPAAPNDPDGSPTDVGYFTFIPPAPRLTNPEVHSDGAAGFVLNAYTNRNYAIDRADALGDWIGLTTVFQSQPATPVIDHSPGPSNHRFYRARLAP